ncbi:MAG TPA: serine/threonine-protein kinase, partial [Candidatus Nanopelagicales bacterium]|nr:serine/threonine-protein kinase [Candidatus Nanopelagicales bacterium]
TPKTTLQDAPAAASLEEVLHREEVARARVFFPTAMALALANLACVPILPFPPDARVPAAAVLLSGVILTGIGRYLAGDPARYTGRRVVLLGAGCPIVAVAILYFIGIFCAGAMVLVLGIHFFATGGNRSAGVATWLAASLSYLVVSVGLALGLLPDIALFPLDAVAPAVQWFQVEMSQFFFAITLFMALRNRAALETAVVQANRAAMQIRQRDAQLAEARRELDRALQAGEGRRSGEVLGGYLLGEVLGRGGMGEVYRAEDALTGRSAAVKVMHLGLVDDEEQGRRFLREAELAAAVRTPYVVEVIDLGRAPDGSPFLVMELLDGHDLGWHLRRRGRLPVAEVVDLLEQLAKALTVMREAGIVHRDLKPGNIVLAQQPPPGPGKPHGPPIWKVLDFGVAKALGRESTLTQNQILGTPSYMAPEQLGGEVDHRTDLYAAAAIAYRALTGSVPFDGDDAAQIAYKVMFAQPTAPSQFVQLPVDVELVLALGLAKKPGDRFDRIEELARAMRLAARSELDEMTRARGWRHLKSAPWEGLRGAPWEALRSAPPDTARVA